MNNPSDSYAQKMQGQDATCSPNIGQYRPPSVTETLEQRRLALEMQLADVNAALTALKANPEFENVMNLLQKAQY